MVRSGVLFRSLEILKILCCSKPFCSKSISWSLFPLHSVIELVILPWFLYHVLGKTVVHRMQFFLSVSK